VKSAPLSKGGLIKKLKKSQAGGINTSIKPQRKDVYKQQRLLNAQFCPSWSQ